MSPSSHHFQLIIECLRSSLLSLTDQFNFSLSTGVVPQCFKSSLVTPIIKNRCLDHNDLKNYQTVCSLRFIAKILKKTSIFYV